MVDSPYGPLSLRDRFLSWLVTGPVGRLVAFVLDFVALIFRTVLQRGN